MDFGPLETAEGSEFSGCRQLSVFLENRLGQLLRLTRLLEHESIRILGLSVEGTIDCAIVRMIVNDPDGAREMFVQNRFAVAECDMLVVELPAGRRGIMAISAALIAGEVNINYLYPIWSDVTHGQGLAIQVDNLPLATQVLSEKNFRLLEQEEL